MKNKSAIIIATQYDNLGDLVINKCLVDEIAKHSETFLDLTNVSEDFQKILLANPNVMSLNKEHGFSFKNITLFKYLLRRKPLFTRLFNSPGPIFISSNKSFKQKLRSKIFESIYKKNRSLGGKSYVVGSEITFTSEESKKKFINNSFSHDKYLLRSKKNVEDIKSLLGWSAEYVPDLCFLLWNSITINKNQGRNHIGVSFRELDSLDHNSNISQTFQNIIEFAQIHKYGITLFYQVERDRDLCVKLMRDFPHISHLTFRDELLSFSEIGSYSEFDFVISNRLHVLLLGYIHGAIAIPVVDSNVKTNKIKNVYDSINSTIPIKSKVDVQDLQDYFENKSTLREEALSISEKQFSLCSSRVAKLFS